MSKKQTKSSKKAASSRKKAASSRNSKGPAADQDVPVGIRAEGMPKFDLNAPTADEIQAAAASTEIEEKLKKDQLAAKIKKIREDMKEEEPAGPGLQEKISVPTKIEIRSCEWGYGVFATTKIEDGEILEEAPIIPLQIRTGDVKENNKIQMLFPHLYPIFCNCADCEELGRHLVLSSGYIQMYNHSEDPNARILQHKANKRVYTIEALKAIEAGEQILLNYGSKYPKRWLQPPHMESTDE
ncbi:SET domain-containing protein-lysine N-methyltransferase [PVC group bacterium]|nr:SET domain-containing protein-lysine N-methyltransferase [PVC group bacterium]